MTKCIVLTQPYVGSLSYTMLIGYSNERKKLCLWADFYAVRKIFFIRQFVTVFLNS